MTAPATYARNADLATLVQVLRGQTPRKLDIVAPASTIRSEGGLIVVKGADNEITLDGVTTIDAHLQPTSIMDAEIAAKLDIPPAYLTRMRETNVDAYDYNVNSWLAHSKYASNKYLVRAFTNNGGPGVGRAFLSDSYKPIENIDVLMQVLEGIRDGGLNVDIRSADLSERRMYVKLYAPEIQVLAPQLLARYRSPFTGDRGADNPVVFAGLEISNSEVGQGAFSIAPALWIQVCKNGMTIRQSAVRAQHLGGKLEAGEIKWSEETQQKNLELIQAKTKDAIGSFLSAEWVQAQIDAMETKAAAELDKPEDTIKKVAATMRYTEAQQDDILKMFIKGGDVTAGGVMHAVTASAQNQVDADVAAAMEADSLRVLELAFANA